MPNLHDCAPGSCSKERSPPGCRAKGAGTKGSPGPPRRTVPSGGVADSLDEAKAAIRAAGDALGVRVAPFSTAALLRAHQSVT